MFESLSEKLTSVLGNLSKKGKLTEQDVDNALRQVRLSMLEADVDYKVTREFISRVKEQVMGAKLFASLSPGQTVIKFVREEFSQILGGTKSDICRSDKSPTIIMVIGLQGTGKTTTTSKLALHLRSQNNSVMMAACDLQRPGAVEQLDQLGKQSNIPVYKETAKTATPYKVAIEAKKFAQKENIQYLIVDTAGRLSINEQLMQELKQIKDAIKPDEILLVLDAMTGQDAVRSGTMFNDTIGMTGIILTKMDGDARGGAALSMKNAVGLPIKFIGIGEKPDQFEPFYPERIASRILGMGDVETLIEKAKLQYTQKEALNLETKIKRNQFTMNDLLAQFTNFKRMGSTSELIGMIPGLNSAAGKINLGDINDDKIKYVEAIILSMTAKERENPLIINGSRRNRIAKGSGTSSAEVNQLLNQFKQMQKLMKRFSNQRSRNSLSKIFGGN
ncbi:MAG: signal recognition particle protein [SAR202 cluster bacterium]|jgi:signal recognition particle subunit SRP54|nr:signal recognition particle protein [Chloroflexota bacterium]MDP6425736.1 signal recognition particle protein [Dehalococcoidia bacterium]MDP7231286.1 signal recognition particle protein [Dehalococcoidia bacterium]MDP7613312.1 signal recognition particle protein [Dehalococcoidia bacterium]MQG46930.1 signal recognition particle protein [SAR202 cluster bacterium]